MAEQQNAKTVFLNHFRRKSLKKNTSLPMLATELEMKFEMTIA
jgi:hypothetical protein